MLSWNINGLSTHKIGDIDFVKYICNYDIIFLYESWANEHTKININGYTCLNCFRKFQHKRSKRCSGGIVVYIKESLQKGISVVKTYHDAIIWVKLDKNFFGLDMDIFLAGVYIWVENSPAYNIINTDLFELLQQDINSYQSKGKVFLIGDWNARVGLKRDYIVCDHIIDFLNDDSYMPDTPCERKSMDRVTNTHGSKLIDLCKSMSLRIANGRLASDYEGSFTFINSSGSSLIDYLLLNDQDFHSIDNFCVAPLTEWSDHCALSFNILCCYNKQTIKPSYEKTSINWSEQNKNEFRRHLIAELPVLNRIVDACSINCDGETIDSCVQRFTDVINDIALPLFKKTTIIDPNRVKCDNRVCKRAEWFDDECRQAKCAFFDSLSVYDRHKTEENRTEMLRLKCVYKMLVKRKRKKFECEKIKRIENLRHSKPKDFWKFFRRKNEKGSGTLTVDDFLKYFSSLQNEFQTPVNNEAEEFCSEYDFDANRCSFEELDKPITTTEVEFIVKKLKRNKACGSDNLLNEYFIECYDILSAHLVDIFNAVLNSGHFPSDWSNGIIVPIFKKNDPCDVRNYRGITLVSCLSKIFTGILNKRLNDWSEKNDILSDAQFGFRKGRSTVDAAFVLNAVVHFK